MQIWLDTINLEVVEDAARRGLLSGVTTNPSILSRTKNVKETLSELLKIQPGPLAIQVTSNDAQKMVQEGERIFQFSKRAVIKVPVNRNGLEAMRHLRQENIPVLGTGVFNPTQALLAAHHGAAYIAPYYAHIGEKAQETLKTISSLLKSRQTKILVASLRTLEDLITCSLIGVEAITIKDDLYQKLIADHEQLEAFIQKFSAEWQQTHGTASIKNLL